MLLVGAHVAVKNSYGIYAKGAIFPLVYTLSGTSDVAVSVGGEADRSGPSLGGRGSPHSLACVSFCFFCESALRELR